MFQDKHPVAWTFHTNTNRWPFNMHTMPDTPNPEAPYKEYFDIPVFPLPEAPLPETSLQDATSARLSCRRFTGESITIAHLGSLLKASYGIQGRVSLKDVEFLERPVPSAGGLYPFELYLLVQYVGDVEPGVYHYNVLYHALEQIRSLRLPRRFISDLFMGQLYVANAAVIVVLSAVVERSLWKYGDRGYRYILLEAGHIAQNLNLFSSAMGLASLNLGGFFDVDLAGLLGVDIERETPLYCVALGVPASNDRVDLRQSGE